jgi:L-2-hydroxyglutarate oxidase LhgO
VVLEAAGQVGTEVSSRNSGVIHAGLYYPKDSLRARMCVAGKHLLYDFCAEHGVPHERTTKLVVATEEEQIPALDALRERAAGNGVDDLVRLDAAEVRALEPAVRCLGALLSPSTGIIDPHEYLFALEADAERHGAVVALSSPVVGGEVGSGGDLVVDVGGSDPCRLACGVLVNAGGLHAQALGRRLRGLPVSTVPPIHYAKGNYFSLRGRSPFRRLVYPMPSGSWLGVHVTLDLAGRCRFGPDLHWVEELDYGVDESRLPEFYTSVRRYWPGLPDGALQPDYTGIRPKLTPPGAAPADFVIQGPGTHGISGLVCLYGIESPGLTSSLAIGEEVCRLLDSPTAGESS